MKFSTNKKLFHSPENFIQKNLLDQGNFPQAKKFSKVKESFHKKKYMIKKIFCKERFLHS